MNILFFLKPKSEVSYLSVDDSVRQALEKMSVHHYTQLPVLDKEGKYVFSLSTSDILWNIKALNHYTDRDAEEIKIRGIKRFRDINPIYSNKDIDELINISLNQNFVPVLDDRDMFIGIITRKDIINYFFDKIKKDKNV